ncbi:Protein of unknown function [Gryllus bimaculatus]|nr:Protein of unknown function [Gryllus bimaculatus]
MGREVFICLEYGTSKLEKRSLQLREPTTWRKPCPVPDTDRWLRPKLQTEARTSHLSAAVQRSPGGPPGQPDQSSEQPKKSDRARLYMRCVSPDPAFPSPVSDWRLGKGFSRGKPIAMPLRQTHTGMKSDRRKF